MARNKDGQERHDRGVAYWARQIITAGWSRVWSDLPGNAKPPIINGYIPDIYALHGNSEYAIEIETQDSVNSEQARQQLAAFRAWAQVGQNRKFETKLV